MTVRPAIVLAAVLAVLSLPATAGAAPSPGHYASGPEKKGLRLGFDVGTGPRVANVAYTITPRCSDRKVHTLKGTLAGTFKIKASGYFKGIRSDRTRTVRLSGRFTDSFARGVFRISAKLGPKVRCKARVRYSALEVPS